MLNRLLAIACLLLLACPVMAGGLFKADFDGSLAEWWSFDCEPVSAKDGIKIKQKASDWYCGGIGTYIAKEGVDLSGYRAIALDILGFGKGSGSIKIELYDDDNGNWQVEQDKKFVAIKDDCWTFQIPVDWQGWKTVNVPFYDLTDENKGGDGKWNIEQGEKSGGLLQVQFIFSASKQTGTANIKIGKIRLMK